MPCLAAVLLLPVLRPLPLALPLAAALLAFGIPTLVRASRRSLTVGRDGIQLQRDTYRLDASWDAVVGLERGRRRGLLRADELILADSSISAVDYRGGKTTLPRVCKATPPPAGSRSTSTTAIGRQGR
jgi:hypothetical protein